MLALFGFVQRVGRGPDKYRQYLSDAVFPFYVLHQTVIIILGVWLQPFGFNFSTESLLLVVGTVMVTALLYHVIVRNMGSYSVLLGGRAEAR